jgi:hypothetical protein
MFRRTFRRGRPYDGGQDRTGTVTAVASAVLSAPRWMRAALGVALAASLWLSSAAALAAETVPPAVTDVGTLPLGLTATQLVVAAAIGAGAGVAVAVASGNALAGASLGFGTLGAIYVAHLAAEALVVGGVYYWWPWQPDDETPASRAISIKGAADHRDPSFPPLRLAPQR